MRVVTALLLVMAAHVSHAASEPFPVPTTGNDIRDAYRAPESHEGRLVGLAGLVEDVKRGPHGKPLVHIRLRDPNDDSTAIWVGSLVDADDISAGEIIRVLGLLARVDPEEAATKALVTDPLFLLGACLVLQSSKREYFAQSAAKQCTAWQAGVMPDGLPRPQANSPSDRRMALRRAIGRQLIIVLTENPDPTGNVLTLRRFVRNDRWFFPVFGSPEDFLASVKGPERERPTWRIDRRMFIHYLPADAVVIFNPGLQSELTTSADELKQVFPEPYDSTQKGWLGR